MVRPCGRLLRVFAHRSFLVNWLDEELLVIEGNISYLTPGETNLWSHPVK